MDAVTKPSFAITFHTNERPKLMKFETTCLHGGGGAQPDPVTNSRGVTLHRTSSYVFNSTQHAADLFALKELGNVYTRLMNPTHDVLEQRVAQLDGGSGALAPVGCFTA